ncbi:MAG TPA: hypothetical protein ENN22_08310 [bacterium]|nr:hypothetical protein [bacterium]
MIQLINIAHNYWTSFNDQTCGTDGAGHTDTQPVKGQPATENQTGNRSFRTPGIEPMQTVVWAR